MRAEVRITGFGGQGVILCGYIIGKAASIYQGCYASMNRSFGPEARGSACSSEVVISDRRVSYPYVRQPNILVALSHEGYLKYLPSVPNDGLLVVEKDLVKTGDETNGRKVVAVPATRIAEELGRKIVLNNVMLGFFTAASDLVPRDAMRQAVETSVPHGTEALNLTAFDRGYAYYEQGPGGN
jgi:2-oxoglutarate ferredoxin oxidoreductase subunit gamma